MQNHTHELTLGLSFLLGAVHALEPGHGKTAMFVYLMGGRRSLWHPVVMGLTTAISHSISLFAIAFTVHLAHHLLTNDHSHELFVSQVLQWVSAVLVIVVGVWMLGRAWLRKGHNCCAHHSHGEACHHEQPSLVQVGVPQAIQGHAQSSGSGKAAFSTAALLGLAVGLLPCPSALAAYFTGLSSGQPWLAYSIIALFAAGIATSLSGVGVLLQLFGNNLGSASQSLNRLPWPYIRACLILAIGLFYAARLVVSPEVDLHVHHH